jgi:dTDP-4-dehydrorhamnose 3,5-epimerase
MSPRLIALKRFSDQRGWFMETYNAKYYAGLGIDVVFCQDNHSMSRAVGVLRGLHFQGHPHVQAKLVRCVRGRIWDVTVDIRLRSPTYGKWQAVELSADIGQQLFIPVGFAHGFLTLEPDTEVEYKTSDFYAPTTEGGIIWNDADLSLPWPLSTQTPIVSERDAAWPSFADFRSPFEYDGVPMLPLQS